MLYPPCSIYGLHIEIHIDQIWTFLMVWPSGKRKQHAICKKNEQITCYSIIIDKLIKCRSSPVVPHFSSGAYGAGQGDTVWSGKLSINSFVACRQAWSIFFSNLTSLVATSFFGSKLPSANWQWPKQWYTIQQVHRVIKKQLIKNTKLITIASSSSKVVG